MRRNGQASLFMVAVSRRGAPGGAVVGAPLAGVPRMSRFMALEDAKENL